ncbi:F-box only protein 36 [Trachymyrmex cornetzi]|uniref:F-box only protein 36 n=1 Tax=Trachymyrmex cornetzi TaxID=471704 RepID=A0A151J9F8_9HYME|nr:F-box only protein 36 [Trachymyrmex cornetzi]
MQLCHSARNELQSSDQTLSTWPSSMRNRIEYLVKYSIAPPPSRDYYGLKIIEDEVILYLWKISHGPHKAPIVYRAKLNKLDQEKSLQNEIRRGFGKYLLKHVKNIAGGNRNLLTLPNSVIGKISKYLEFTDILKLSSLSHIAYEVFNTDLVWQILYTRDKKANISLEGKEKVIIYGWKQLYKDKEMQASIKDRTDCYIYLNGKQPSDSGSAPSLRERKKNTVYYFQPSLEFQLLRKLQLCIPHFYICISPTQPPIPIFSVRSRLFPFSKNRFPVAIALEQFASSYRYISETHHEVIQYCHTNWPTRYSNFQFLLDALVNALLMLEPNSDIARNDHSAARSVHLLLSVHSVPEPQVVAHIHFPLLACVHSILALALSPHPKLLVSVHPLCSQFACRFHIL